MKKYTQSAKLFPSSAAVNLHIPAEASETPPAPTSWRAVPGVRTQGKRSMLHFK